MRRSTPQAALEPPGCAPLGGHARRPGSALYALGLIVAVQHFDPAKGVAFSTCATTAIHRWVRREAQEHYALIHVPQHIHRYLNHAAQGKDVPPSRHRQEQLRAGRTAQRIRPIQHAGDSIPNRDVSSRLNPALEHWLETRLATLPERDRRVLGAWYGLDGSPQLTGPQIAAREGITKHWVEEMV